MLSQAPHHRRALKTLAGAIATVAVMTGPLSRGAASQALPNRTFGPGRCGPIDSSYVRVTNATGGQVLPLGPTEAAAAGPLMTASFGTETVFWATASLKADRQTITVPVDGVSSRVAFILSTDGSIGDMSITDPRGTLVTTGAGVDTFQFGCIRGATVERPAAGDWTVRVGGAGTYWLVVHAASNLGLDDAAFVRVGGRPGHEGLFRIPGQPMRGRPAILRARVTREEVADTTFDLVSMSGERLQTVDLLPVTTSATEEEYVGEIARLPDVPFRVRVSGRDRTGAAYQRMSRPAFHTATVEVVAPQAVTLSGQRTQVTVTIRNVGAPAQLRVVAVLDAAVLRVEPATLQLGPNESRDVAVWADLPATPGRPSSQLVVTAEDPADPAASNSAIVDVQAGGSR